MIINRKQIVYGVLRLQALSLLPACWPFGKKVRTKEHTSLYVINVLDKGRYEDCRIAGFD